MFINQFGVMRFDDIGELNYNLLNSIGLSINGSGYVYDQDTGIMIQDAGRLIKASIDPNSPCFAGQGEVVFDVINNIRLVTTLFGYALDKATAMEGFDSVSNYIDEWKDDPRATSICIKMADGSVKNSGYYFNKCLKFVAAIFSIDDTLVDLNNFDKAE